MTTDINKLVTQLREDAKEIKGWGAGIEAERVKQAADLIESLVLALKPFARAAELKPRSPLVMVNVDRCRDAHDVLRGEIVTVWQPIETAPKDGTVVDLWSAGERLTGFAWRSTGVIGWTKTEGYPAVTRVLRGNKCTHWMPAPEGPTT